MSQRKSGEESNLARKLREYEERKRAGMRTPSGGTTPPVGTDRPPQQRPPQQPRRPPAQPVPPPPQQPRRPKPEGRSGRRQGGVGVYIPWWGIVVLVGIVGALTCGLWAFVLTTRPDVAGTGVLSGLTPTFVVITSTPTPGVPEPLNPPPEEVPATPTPTEEPPPRPPPGTDPTLEIVIGSQVMIYGTEGDGLAMRQGPGVNYAIVQQADDEPNIAFDGQVFDVQDGPRENDDLVWWYIVDPEDPDRFGWAAAGYMLKVPGSDPGALQEATPLPTEEATQGA